MDWSKAKNILIVAFIMTNIFLIYNVQNELFNSQGMQIVSDQYIINVEEHLRDHNIKLKTDIPKEIIPMSILEVKYKTFDPDDYLDLLLGEGYKEVETTQGFNRFKKQIFTNDKRELVIEGGKKFKYTDMSQEKANYILDENTIVEISNDFLKDKKVNTEDLKLEQIYYGEEKDFGSEPVYKLVYNQRYKNRFLGESYINVYINHRGVVRVEAMILEYENTKQQKRTIMPATEALMQVMNIILKENKTPIAINKIEIGYYFSPAYYLNTDWKDIESGTAFPSWKITLDNGKTYYVEAYKI